MGAAANSVCSLSRVSFRYAKDSPLLLNEVDFTVFSGTRVAVIGDNGVGKSTVARLLLGFLSPVAGEVTVFGRRASWSCHYPHLGYVGDLSYFDGEGALPPDIPANRLIRCFETLAFQKTGRPPFATSLLNRLGLTEARFKSPIGALSRGERQRVLVYLALAKQPMLLIADEPTEGLDPNTRDLLLESVGAYVKASGAGMVWITHRYDEVAGLVDSVFKLQEGSLWPVLHSGYHAKVFDGRARKTFPTIPGRELVNLVARLLIDDRTAQLDLHAVKNEPKEAT